MTEQDPQVLLGAAEKLVAKATAAGADQAEVYWTREVGLSIDIENNAVQNTGRSREEGGAVRVIRDGRVGFAYFSQADDGPKAIQRALDLSRLSPKKDLMLPASGSYPALGRRWDEGLAALDTEQALEQAMRLLAARAEHAPDAQLAGGGVSVGWNLDALANSEGVAVADRTTSSSVGVNLVMQEGERAINIWDSEARETGWPDTDALALRVIGDLRDLRSPAKAVGGTVDVVFRPEAVAELLSSLIIAAVDGDDALRGKTVWSDKLGEEVADKRLRILDDPLRGEAIGAVPFDGDGVPTRRMPIIEDGVLRNFLFDIRDGSEHGKESTASGVRGGFRSPPSVGTHHFVVEGDGAQAPDKIIGGVDDGYVVESVLGAHTANATTGDFSITAPNVWRIKGGEVESAVEDIAISGNLPELLHRIDGIGSVPRRMDGAWIPMLRFRDVHVSV